MRKLKWAALEFVWEWMDTHSLKGPWWVCFGLSTSQTQTNRTEGETYRKSDSTRLNNGEKMPSGYNLQLMYSINRYTVYTFALPACLCLTNTRLQCFYTQKLETHTHHFPREADKRAKCVRALTDTMRPSEGMKAGLLLSLSLVCRVLKLISSWHFSWTCRQKRNWFMALVVT